MELSPLAVNVHFKMREASENTHLNIQEVLGIHKALQSIQGELVNNSCKIIEIDKQIDSKK